MYLSDFTQQSGNGHGGVHFPSAFSAEAALQPAGFFREQQCLMNEKWITHQRFISWQPVIGLAVEPRARTSCQDQAASAPWNKGCSGPCTENFPNSLRRVVGSHTALAAPRSRQSRMSHKLWRAKTRWISQNFSLLKLNRTHWESPLVRAHHTNFGIRRDKRRG